MSPRFFEFAVLLCFVAGIAGCRPRAFGDPAPRTGRAMLRRRSTVLFCIALAIPFGSAQAIDCVARASEGIESGRPEDAIPDLKKGARHGDERCAFIMGLWSLQGIGMPQDAVSGARWLSEAAAEGLPIAQSSLGLLYASGWGVTKDEVSAAEWYRAAASYGDPLGQAALGAAVFLGTGVEKDVVEGYAWTSLAASGGNQKARAHLPEMERAMTADQISQAKTRATEFQPSERPEKRRLNQHDLLRTLGLSGRPSEYERFFGY